MEQVLEEALREALVKTLADLQLTLDPPPINLEIPADRRFGDWSSNLALLLASQLKKAPRQIARALVDNLSAVDEVVERVEIAGPGFINFHVHPHWWSRVVREVNEEEGRFGNLNLGQGEKVQVEFVSANPTGPLHVGHGRGAATGDALAALLQKAGYTVQKEYYINDAGNQMNLLGRSVYLRYRRLLGRGDEFIENGYQGEYITEIARGLVEEQGERWIDDPEGGCAFCSGYAVDRIMAGIKRDLSDFGVEFDHWFSEKTLFEEKEVERVIKQLRKVKHIVSREGALWLLSSKWGDEKDRVVVRGNGEPTYFASDMAYHWDKLQRGFTRIINVWGADHHGYVPRLRAAVQAMGYPARQMEVILVHLVRLLRNGEPVSMSTRQGEFVTLAEVVGEVGKDATRFFFLTRRSDSPLDFDLELAKKQSAENPVYYVQYAHARICSVFAKAAEAKVHFPSLNEAELSLLNLTPELDLMKKLAEFSFCIAGAARAREPHRLTFYAQDLAALFHRYYNKHRIIGDDEGLCRARLLLVRAVQIVLAEALRILGVSAPQKM